MNASALANYSKEPGVGIDPHAVAGGHEAPQHRAGVAAPVASEEDPVVAPPLRRECCARCGCRRSPGRRSRCSGSEPSSSSACIGRPAPLDFSVALVPASPADIHAACPEWAATRAGATPTALPHSIRVPARVDFELGALHLVFRLKHRKGLTHSVSLD